MSEQLDEQEVKVAADTGLYLAEAMFPADKLPGYAGISTQREAKHYAAVEASTELGEKVIEHIEKLKKLQSDYYIKEKDTQIENKKLHDDEFNNFIDQLIEIKKLEKTDHKQFIKQLKFNRKRYYQKREATEYKIKNNNEVSWKRYSVEANKHKLNIEKLVLISYRNHVTNQLTHGVSVKGHGRNEVSNIQTSQRTGANVPVHKRSRYERLTGQNKEPKIGEKPNV